MDTEILISYNFHMLENTHFILKLLKTVKENQNTNILSSWALKKTK